MDASRACLGVGREWRECLERAGAGYDKRGDVDGEYLNRGESVFASGEKADGDEPRWREDWRLDGVTLRKEWSG